MDPSISMGTTTCSQTYPELGIVIKNVNWFSAGRNVSPMAPSPIKAHSGNISDLVILSII